MYKFNYWCPINFLAHNFGGLNYLSYLFTRCLDIFDSMIQAVVNPEERANQGMHYTSVPNIMKVINPLFLDELRGEYNKLNEFYEQKLQMKNIGALSGKQFG